GGTGGGVTGGGGGSCDGCIFQGPNGPSCISRVNSNNNTLCGQGGVQCATCSGTQTCVNYLCSGGTGGGGGVTGGGGGTTGGGGGSTTNQPVGGACASTSNCASGLTCKTTTTRGDVVYPSGYCTKPCAASTECGAGNECIGGSQSTLQFYGESAGFCVNSCPSAGSISTCRSGYTCEFNEAGMPGVCWLDPIPNFNGGAQATNSGNACTVDTCQPSGMNPLLSVCLKANLPDGGASGWTQGYCTADCSFDNTGNFCGSTATCVTLGQAPNTSDLCLKTCATPGGRSTCRNPGYSCFALSGGTTNICYPDCTITGCSTGTCSTVSGQCQ
ncbi:MAG: hypothetical protein Q8N23_14480, partial [Archangium sp.]|nr:hypothetical protein [Archangium sp.]